MMALAWVAFFLWNAFLARPGSGYGKFYFFDLVQFSNAKQQPQPLTNWHVPNHVSIFFCAKYLGWSTQKLVACAYHHALHIALKSCRHGEKVGPQNSRTSWKVKCILNFVLFAPWFRVERVCEWALLVKSVSKLYLQVDLICQLDICSVIDRSRVRFPVAAALAIFLFLPFFLFLTVRDSRTVLKVWKLFLLFLRPLFKYFIKSMKYLSCP